MNIYYLSGPITHKEAYIEKENKNRFKEKELELTAQGFEVHNCTKNEQKGLTWKEYMIRDIEYIVLNRPIMYMMVGWEHSRGAKIEHDLAKVIGLEIVYE